jgi:hypothetical protein
MLNRVLILMNIVQLAAIVALVAAWISDADGASLSRIAATAGTAFAAAIGLGLVVWNALSQTN